MKKQRQKPEYQPTIDRLTDAIDIVLDKITSYHGHHYHQDVKQLRTVLAELAIQLKLYESLIRPPEDQL